MSYGLKDIKHLSVMADLENKPAEPIDYRALVKIESDDEIKKEPSLQEDILVLCSRLRSNGFEKQAASLESKFGSYKIAAVNYMNETGNDLMNYAHPEGDVETARASDHLAFVETNMSQKMKFLDVARRAPTGKTASSLQKYVDACKVVKAQAAPAAAAPPVPETKESLLKSIEADFNMARGAWKEAYQQIEQKGGLVNGLMQFGRGGEWAAMSNKINVTFDESRDIANLTIDTLEGVKKAIANLYQFLKPGASWAGGLNPWGGLSKDLWNTLSGNFDLIDNRLDSCISKRSKYNKLFSKEVEERLLKQDSPSVALPSATTPATVPTASENVAAKIKAAKQQLTGISLLVDSDTSADAEDVKSIRNWIISTQSRIENLEKAISSANPDDILAGLGKVTKDFERVKKEWA